MRLAWCGHSAKANNARTACPADAPFPDAWGAQGARSGTVQVMSTNATPPRSFGSVATAMVTPFHQDGKVDLDTAASLATHLVELGCDALVINGTTGESPTTHQPEKDALVRVVLEAVGDRAMIIGAASSNDTAHAVRMAKGQQAAGAHGLLIVTPYYNRPSQQGLIAHVEAIAEATDVPLMLYDIPGRTGLAIGDEALDRFAEHPRILAVKDATGNVPAGFERMARTGLEYYSGDDDLNFAWLAHGASGVVSVVGHVIAGLYAEMVQEVDDGDLVAARRVATAARTIVQVMMGTGQGAVMAKEAMHLQGHLPSPTVRLPLVRATDEEIAALKTVLLEEGLL